MMKRLIVVGIILVAMAVMLCPSLVGALSYAQIAITATGSDVSISCSQTDWDAGTLSHDEVAMTTDNDTWGRITNNTSEAVDVTIHGHDMAGSGVTWTLSEDGTNGVATIGMKFVLDGGAYQAIPKTTPAAFKTDLAGSGTQDFGLYLKAPASGVGNVLMTMSSGGLYFEATLHT